MRGAMSSGRRLARKSARRVSRLAAVFLLAPAVAGADPPTTAAAGDVGPTASEASPSPSAHSTHAPGPGPGESRAALRPARPRTASLRDRQLDMPTRRSVRAHIESIDPTAWLRRYGTVERRQLPPCERCDLDSGVHLEATPTDSQ
jgi:hypothetical protein